MKKDNYLIMISTFGSGIGLGLQFYFATIKAGSLINPILSTLMMGVYFATSSIFGIIVGKLSDHFRKRKIFGIFGNITSGIIFIQYFFVSDAFFFIFYSFLIGITTGLVGATIPALFTENEPDLKKGKLISYYNICNSAGWAVSVLLGEIIFFFIGDFIYFVFGVVPIIASVLLLFCKEDHLQYESKEKIDEINENQNHYDLIKPFLIYLAILLAFRHLTSQGTISSLLPNYLVLELKSDEFLRGIIYSSNTFLQVVLMIPIGHLVDKFGRKTFLTIGVTCTMISAFGYGISTSPLQVIPFQISLAIGWTSLINSASAYIIDVTTPQDRAKGMGYLNAGLSIGGTAGPFLAGLSLFIFNQNFQISFIFLSLFAIPSIILCLLIKEDKKHHVYEIFNKKSRII
ncbi:MAG: MFS transporter [Candidatus Helarchaeota archaeon]